MISMLAGFKEFVEHHGCKAHVHVTGAGTFDVEVFAPRGMHFSGTGTHTLVTADVRRLADALHSSGSDMLSNLPLEDCDPSLPDCQDNLEGMPDCLSAPLTTP